MPRAREKRQAHRIQPFVIPCRIVFKTTRLSGHLVDLSVAGARIASEAELPKKGSRVAIEARFGSAAAPMSLRGEVKWNKKAEGSLEGHLAGVTFQGITARQKLAVEFVLYEFRRRAASLS